jgi:hypothetical protein
MDANEMQSTESGQDETQERMPASEAGGCPDTMMSVWSRNMDLHAWAFRGCIGVAASQLMSGPWLGTAGGGFLHSHIHDAPSIRVWGNTTGPCFHQAAEQSIAFTLYTRHVLYFLSTSHRVESLYNRQ